MKQANKLGQLIVQLAKRFEFDLSATYGHLSLTMPGYQTLVIEKHGPRTVAFMFVDDAGALDPMVRLEVFPIKLDWNNEKSLVWFPTDVQMYITGRTKQYMWNEGEQKWGMYKSLQADLAKFCNGMLYENTKNQGWLDNATVLRKFVVTQDSAVLVKPNGDWINAVPASTDNRFGLKEICELVECGTIEWVHDPVDFSSQDTKFMFWGDEDARMVSEEYIFENSIATRFLRYDRTGDNIVGNILITPSKWSK